MFFGELSSAERSKIEQIGYIQHFHKDESVVVEGEESSTLYLVKSGKVQVRKGLGTDTSICLMELGPEGIFGEMAFLGLNRRTASVVALEDTEVLAIEEPSFRKLLESDPEIGVKVYRNVARELARRLCANTEELRRALLWALEEMKGLDKCIGA